VRYSSGPPNDDLIPRVGDVVNYHTTPVNFYIVVRVEDGKLWTISPDDLVGRMEQPDRYILTQRGPNAKRTISRAEIHRLAIGQAMCDTIDHVEEALARGVERLGFDIVE
jgi:hypothetical protein